MERAAGGKTMRRWVSCYLLRSALLAALLFGHGYLHAQSLTDWSYIGGNAGHWGYSPARQINTATVSQLGLLWAVDLPVPDGLVGNPLVRDGVVYQGAPRGIVLAHDVATGRLLWKFEPVLDLAKTSLTGFYGVNKNRGIGLDEHNVYVTSGDCHLYAVDRRTGRQAWVALSCDPTRDYGTIAAPRTGEGQVFVGNNNHELGSERGFEDAFDAATGRHLWRFYTIPGDPSKPFENQAMEMASKSWDANAWRYTHGGANPWDGAIYDPQTGLLIFGSGNPDVGHFEKGWMRIGPGDAQMQADERTDEGKRAALAEGDWLFSSTILAVNARTGAYAWHLQLVPHDRFESDAAAGFIIADLQIRGRKRHVVMQAAKDGYFYVLDARSGACLSARNYVPIETFEPIDPNSCQLRPKQESKYWLHPERPVVLQPGGYGSHGWERAAYSPSTGLVYIPAFIYPERIGGPAHYDPDYGFRPGDKYQAGGRLIAWDPIGQRERWHVNYPVVQNGGVLATAGNLVLQGTPSGKFLAYAADTGRLLWSFDTQSVILGEPTAVMAGDREIILVPAGDGGASVSETDTPRIASTTKTLARSRLLAFALGGSATLPATPPKVVNKPPRAPQPAALAARGALLYASNSCELCHGPDAINGGGHIPDLRNMPDAMFQALPAILQKGALRQGGMPQFPYFTDDDINALQAYLINQAWAGYTAQQAQNKQSPRR